MSAEFEDWLRRSLEFLSQRLNPDRALEALGQLLVENPELYAEFMRDARVQRGAEAQPYQNDQSDLLN